MGSMPEVIDKGPIFGKMDKVLNNKPNRVQMKTDLESGTPLLTLADAAHYDFLDTDERNHMDEHWFSNPDWLCGQVESVMREGLIAALEWAMNPAPGGGAVTSPPDGPLPPPRQADIACFWVCDPGHATPRHPQGECAPLEVSISWDSDRVTVIFHTPHPNWDSNPTAYFEDSVVVKENPALMRVRVPIHQLP